MPSPITRRFAALVLLASVATGALAQSPPATQDPREMDETQRRVYTQSLHEAKSLLDRKQYADATATLDRLIAERPREPQARFLKGIALTDEGRTDDAIAVFRGLLADFPELPEPRNNLAVLYAQKGEYAQARDELELAVRTAPDYAVAHENLGDVYARLAQLEYEKTVALDKRNRTAAAKLKLIRETPPAAQ
ncbi:MAG TPA: tetratricopeptide repeat protein [Casimicrobiaceae bacterium]|nr:tetratricopeptide repeat protein [Casimicrobiaceae bacterium]